MRAQVPGENVFVGGGRVSSAVCSRDVKQCEKWKMSMEFNNMEIEVISQSCHNKLPHTTWLKDLFFHNSGGKKSEIEVLTGHALPEACGG